MHGLHVPLEIPLLQVPQAASCQPLAQSFLNLQEKKKVETRATMEKKFKIK